MITEGWRDRMRRRLKEVLGDEEATTLMEHLPPKGWEDVATKGDLTRELGHMREWVELKLEALRHELRSEIATLRGEMHATFRTHTVAIIGATAALNGMVVALLR